MEKLSTKQAYRQALELNKKIGEHFQYLGINGMNYSITIANNKKGYVIKRFDKSGL